VGQVARWCIAGLATAAVFAAGTALSGLVILAPLVRAAADRWVIASGLGVAVAALAALWGASWAGAEDRQARLQAGGGTGEAVGRAVSASRGGIAFGGDNYGIASTRGAEQDQ
jgi:hypothetical protein